MYSLFNRDINNELRVEFGSLRGWSYLTSGAKNKMHLLAYRFDLDSTRKPTKKMKQPRQALQQHKHCKR